MQCHKDCEMLLVNPGRIEHHKDCPMNPSGVVAFHEQRTHERIDHHQFWIERNWNQIKEIEKTIEGIKYRIEKFEQKPEAKKAKCDNCYTRVVAVGGENGYSIISTSNQSIEHRQNNLTFTFPFCPNCGNKND